MLRGVLDVCLLALVSEEPCYGYEIVGKMRSRGLVLVGEGSIYPLLSRLQRAGLVEGYVVASTEGPKRKYYRILPKGAERLAVWREEWRRFSGAVDSILGEER